MPDATFFLNPWPLLTFLPQFPITFLCIITGYRLSYNSLVNKNSTQLDAIGSTSSIKRLAERLIGTETFSSLIFGPRSFGKRLEAEGITINGEIQSLSAVPSQENESPFPNEDDYFGATKSPVTNDHRDKVSAIQCEIHKDYRDNPGGKVIRELYQAEYSRAFGDAAVDYFMDFYGEYWSQFSFI